MTIKESERHEKASEGTQGTTGDKDAERGEKVSQREVEAQAGQDYSQSKGRAKSRGAAPSSGEKAEKVKGRVPPNLPGPQVTGEFMKFDPKTLTREEFVERAKFEAEKHQLFALRLVREDSDDTDVDEKREELGLFVDTETRKALAKISDYLAGIGPQALYVGWSGQVYPCFKIEKVALR